MPAPENSKKFACGDIVPGCAFTATAPTEDALMQNAPNVLLEGPRRSASNAAGRLAPSCSPAARRHAFNASANVPA
jgi:hypothetical protein